jgi:WD40 repeat protein
MRQYSNYSQSRSDNDYLRSVSDRPPVGGHACDELDILLGIGWRTTSMGSQRRVVLFVAWLTLPFMVEGAEPASDTQGDPLPTGAVARLGSIRLRAAGPVEQILFSHDGKRIAVWSGGWLEKPGLTIWDRSSGKELNRFSPKERSKAWAWREVDRIIAVTESDGRHSLHEVQGGKMAERALPDRYKRGSFALGLNGRMLAVAQPGERGYTISFVELAAKPGDEPKLLRVGQSKLELTTDLKFTANGKTLLALTPSRDSPRWTYVIWDVATATERCKLSVQEPTEELSIGTWVSSDDRLAIGATDGSVRLYDLATGQERRMQGLHKPRTNDFFGGVAAIAFTPDGKTLVTVGYDQAIRHWDVSNGKKLREYATVESFCRTAVVSHDGNTLALGGNDGTVRLVDALKGTALLPQPGHQGPLIGAVVSRDGRTVVTSGLDRTIRVWELDPGAREIRRIEVDRYAADLATTPDFSSAVARTGGEGGWAGMPLRRWSLPDGKELPHPESSKIPTRSMRMAAAGNTLVTVQDQKIVVRNWPTGELLREFALPKPQSQGFTALGKILAVSPDGKLVVASVMHVNLVKNRVLDAEGGTVDLWDATTGKHLIQLSPGGDLYELAAFVPDGRLLFAADIPIPGDSPDPRSRPLDAVHLIDPRTGSVIRTFGPRFPRNGGRSSIKALAVSTDSRTAYIGSADGPIYVCEIATGGVRQRLEGHRDQVTDLALAIDTRRLVSASSDGTALVWDLTLPVMAAPKDFNAAWNELSAADAATAYKAQAAFATDAVRGLRFLADILRPADASPTDAKLDQMIADLDSSKYAERQRAESELEKLAGVEVDRIRVRLTATKTAESRARLNRLLEKAEAAPLTPARLREIRVLELLEHLGNADARALVAKLANGNPSARLTQDAIATLRRFEIRSSRER